MFCSVVVPQQLFLACRQSKSATVEKIIVVKRMNSFARIYIHKTQKKTEKKKLQVHLWLNEGIVCACPCLTSFEVHAHLSMSPASERAGTTANSVCGAARDKQDMLREVGWWPVDTAEEAAVRRTSSGRRGKMREGGIGRRAAHRGGQSALTARSGSSPALTDGRDGATSRWQLSWCQGGRAGEFTLKKKN